MAIETNGEEVHDHFKMAFQFNYFEMTPLNPDCPFHAVHSEFILIWTFAPITKSVKHASLLFLKPLALFELVFH